jgi:hypothetical protein
LFSIEDVPRSLNLNASNADQISTANFNNSYNRVQFADINNYQNDPANDFYDETLNYEYNQDEEGPFTVTTGDNENEEEAEGLAEFGDELNAGNENGPIANEENNKVNYLQAAHANHSRANHLKHLELCRE